MQYITLQYSTVQCGTAAGYTFIPQERARKETEILQYYSRDGDGVEGGWGGGGMHGRGERGVCYGGGKDMKRGQTDIHIYIYI